MNLSRHIYGFLLRIYPACFLGEYKDALQQAFRDQMRDANSVRKRTRLWVATCDDLLRSALTVHIHEKESYGVKLSALAAYLSCAAATTFLMRFERRTDDAGVVTFFILATTFVLGCIHPRRARLWSLAGLCVPAAHFQAGSPVPSWSNTALLSAFVTVVGLASSHAGVLFRKMFTR